MYRKSAETRRFQRTYGLKAPRTWLKQRLHKAARLHRFQRTSHCSRSILGQDFAPLVSHCSSCAINNMLKQELRTGHAIRCYGTVRRPFRPITVSFNLVGGLNDINYDEVQNCEDFILDRIHGRIFPEINNHRGSTEFISTRCDVSEWNVPKSEESQGDNRPLINSSLVTNININHRLYANPGQFESGWRARLRNASFLIQ